MFHVEHHVNYQSLSQQKADSVKEFFDHAKKNLSEYTNLLLWWNKKINLISRDVSRETIRLHIEHSLTPSLSSLFNDSPFIIDAGTGGGLPGIPLAISHPEKQFLLNDIVSKKITACKHMTNQLKLNNIKGNSSSIQNVDFKEGSLIVSKHAFKINDLIEMVGNKKWSGIILLKGKDDIEKELHGIDQELSISVLDLYSGFNESFYKGKALIEITKA